MKCEIRIVSGARAGHREVFDKSYIGLGRHPLSDVRFDAEKDLDASTRHAAILKTGDQWILRDLGSRNGTFVNGEKTEGDRPLHDGDAIRFGVHGPEVSFHLLAGHDHGEVVMEAIHAPPPSPEAPGRATHDRSQAPSLPPAAARKPAPAPPSAPAPQPRAPSATSVLRAELLQQTSRTRALTWVLATVMVGAAGVLAWQGLTAKQRIETTQAALDTALQEIATLRTAKIAADSDVARLSRLLAAESDPAARQALQARYDSARRRVASITAAQAVDYTAIRAANDRAIAIIFVRFSDTTQMWTGTAFSVSTSGVMLTNRHVVTNDRGERPRDIAIQFSGSTDVLPARLVRMAPDADLAVVQLESAGPFPAVAGLAREGGEPAVGTPIALIGFPGGGGETAVPNAKLVTGSVARVIPDSLLQLDAFSGVGASGSPIFDRNGRVIGVEFGGIRESGGTVILGLPIRRALALLPS